MKKMKYRKRCIMVVTILLLVGNLVLWTRSTETEVYASPEQKKQPLSPYLQKELLSSEDYLFLQQQTGLYPPAIDALHAKGQMNVLPEYQEAYFRGREYLCEPNTIISWEERLTEAGGKICLPALEDGDILITFNCHVFGWRCGHAALVIDAEQGLTLEARVLGTDSAILSIAHWEAYPSCTILRLKNVGAQQRAEIAAFAREKLVGIPYHITAGFFKEGNTQLSLSGTQCAHLVWYVYSIFGFDLNSDGTKVITPRDIYDSPLLEPIQEYGKPYLDK